MCTGGQAQSCAHQNANLHSALGTWPLCCPCYPSCTIHHCTVACRRDWCVFLSLKVMYSYMHTWLKTMELACLLKSPERNRMQAQKGSKLLNCKPTFFATLIPIRSNKVHFSEFLCSTCNSQKPFCFVIAQWIFQFSRHGTSDSLTMTERFQILWSDFFTLHKCFKWENKAGRHNLSFSLLQSCLFRQKTHSQQSRKLLYQMPI